jgi:uncharacterized membrane protein
MMTRARVLTAAIVLVAAMAAFAFRLSTSMADFEVYWRGAPRAAAAEPLYRAEDGHFQFKYLPAFAVLTIPLGLLPLPVAKAVWFAVSVVLLCLLVWLSVDLLPHRRKSAGLLVAVVIIVLGKFFAHELVLGQVNILFAVLAAAAFVAMRRGRESLAGVLIAFTIAIKPYGVLFVPWLFARKKRASVLTVAVTAIVIAVLPLAVYGLAGTIALHRAWWTTVAQTTPANLTNPDNVSFASMWVKWIGSGPTATVLAAVTAAAALGIAILVFLRRRGLLFPEALEGSLLLILVPVLSPQGWDYVLLLAAPAVVLLANYEDRLPAIVRTAIVVAALTIGLSLFDVIGRRAYGVFMGYAVISVCAVVLITALCAMRLRKVA